MTPLQWISQLRSRLRALLHGQRLESDIEEEIHFHMAMREQRLRERGTTSEQASLSAQGGFGNATRVKETCRDLWTFLWLEDLRRDLVYGSRILARDRVFTAVAVLSLALAIGVNTAIFTLVNAALIEKLPVSDPDRLVVANWSHGGGRINIFMTNASHAQDPKSGLNLSNVFQYGAFERFRTRTRKLSDIFAFTSPNRAALRTEGRTDLVRGMLVSGNYYKGLGIRTMAGRLLDQADERADAEPAVVISYQLWRDRFAWSAAAIGAKVTLSGVPVTIVGVTQPEFYGVSPGGFMPSPDVTLTLAMTPRIDPRLIGASPSAFLESTAWWLNVMGRLRPGVDARSAETELNALFRQSIDEADLRPEDGKLPVLRLFPGDQGLDSVRASYYEFLLMLWGVAAVVLLIACANVATLLVARGAARQGEVTVRLAIGAGRVRICRQLVTEGLLLSLAAGVIGILFSIWGSRALMGWATSPVETLRLPLGVSARVLGFATGLSLMVGVLFSLAPALRMSCVDLSASLKEAVGRASHQRHSGRLGQGLIVLQVALSLLLVVGAGLFLRTLGNLRSVDLGLRTQGILLFGLDPTLNNYSNDRSWSLYRDLLERLNKTPGVVSATASSMRLLSGGMSGGPLRVPGAAWLPRMGIQAHVNGVAPRFFETMAIPVILGRGPNERDTASSPRVAFLSQSMARRAFPDGAPLGRTVSLLFEKNQYVVAGVVADAHYDQVKGAPPLTVYVPYQQTPWSRAGSLHFAVRTQGEPEAFVGTVRSLVRALDPSLPLVDVQTQEAVVEDQLRRERLFANLSTAFAAIALLLACIGIYGVVAYSAAQRTAEIGMRVALGARYGNIVGLVLRRTLILVALGVAVGSAAALWMTKFVASMLYNIEPRDQATFIAGAVVLLVTAIVAGYLPARRAARIEPMKALRCE
jgi:predicted permease